MFYFSMNSIVHGERETTFGSQEININYVEVEFE